MENLIKKRNLSSKISCDSKATHTDEIGSEPYYETKRVLKQNSIPLMPHVATQVVRDDLGKFDLILCMDNENKRALERIFGQNSPKVKFLLEFAKKGANSNIIDDPYYTRDFEKCYADIFRGCEGLCDDIENLAIIW